MKKAWNIIRTVLVWLLVIVAVTMTLFTVISVTTFDRNDRNLFGYRAYIVRSDSMSKTDFNAGDLILVKEVDPSTLQPGDIITYMSQNTDSFGEIITHKIRERTMDSDKKPGFITYGTTTDTNDEVIVTYPYILGKYEKAIPKMGTFFNFVRSVPGYFLCIFLPFMLLVVYEAVNFFNLFRRYKKEQMAQMQFERDQIAAEREENAKMMAQLQQMKAQLEAQMNGGKSDEAAAQEERDSQTQKLKDQLAAQMEAVQNTEPTAPETAVQEAAPEAPTEETASEAPAEEAE